MIGLKTSLRLRMELKKPQSYEDAVDVAKRKEWKLGELSQLGMVDSFLMAKEIRRPKSIVQRAPMEVLQSLVHPIVSPIVPRTVTIAMDYGLRQEMKQVVDLMKILNINLLNSVRNGCNGGRQSNQPKQHGKSLRQTPTCYNCGELGHINLRCDKQPRQGRDMYPLRAQLFNRSNDYGIKVK